MRVGELRAILAGAPADAPVTVRGTDGLDYEVSRLVYVCANTTFFPARDLVARGPHVAVIVGEKQCPPSS